MAAESTTATQDKLAELIWRAVQLRITLLVLLLFGILITWSALASGDQKAKDLDQEYCRKIVARDNATFPQSQPKVGPPIPSGIEPDIWCTERGSLTYVEASRAASSMLSPSNLGSSSTPAISKIYNEQLQLLSEYDAKRRSLYGIQIQLSSVFSGSSILVDALPVAEFAPFVALVIGSVVMILGFQEKAQKEQLKVLIEGDGLGRTLAATLARTSFFVLPLIVKERKKRWLFLSAEKLTLCSLGTAVCLCLLTMMSRFIVHLVHLTDSMFNYASLLLLVSLILVWWLFQTRDFYLKDWAVQFSSTDDSGTQRGTFRATMIVLASLAFASLFLPWASPFNGDPLRGTYFLIRQPTIVRKMAPSLPDTYSFLIEPNLYRELRIQIWIAIAFLCFCLLTAIWRQNMTGLRKILRLSQLGLGGVTVFLSLNLILYMVILEYEADIGASWGFQNTFASALVGERFGWPLEFYNPSYGFLIFVLCCFGMFWYSSKKQT